MGVPGARRLPMLGLAFLLPAVLAGCASSADYPIAAPAWTVGDWWTFRSAAGDSTVVVLDVKASHALLARVPGDGIAPVAGANVLAVDTTTFLQDASWSLGGSPGDWGLGEAKERDDLPLVRLPLAGLDDSWDERTVGGLGALLGSEGSFRIEVASDGPATVAGRRVVVVHLSGRIEDTSYFLGIPLDKSSHKVSASYSPDHRMLTRFDVPAFLSAGHGWALDPTTDRSKAVLVATGHTAPAPLDAYLRFDLEDGRPTSQVLAGPTEVGLRDGEPWLLEATNPSDFFACTGDVGVFRAWDGDRLVASAAAKGDHGRDSCTRTATLDVPLPFAGTLTFQERNDQGVLEYSALPARVGQAVAATATCVPLPPTPCTLWQGTPGIGEQVWLRGTPGGVAGNPTWTAPPQLALLDAAGTVLERKTWEPWVPVTFQDEGDGTARSVVVEVTGAVMASASVALLPALRA